MITNQYTKILGNVLVTSTATTSTQTISKVQYCTVGDEQTYIEEQTNNDEAI